jgi:small subunit ribosomal protein S15
LRRYFLSVAGIMHRIAVHLKEVKGFMAKNEILAKCQRFPGDTGSPEAQIAILTGSIEHLHGHFQMNKKDHHSRQGLLKKVSLRRKLLNYLKRINPKGYLMLVKQLGLRG